MPAIDNFKKTIDRAQSLVERHKQLCPRDKPKTEYGDILRAAVVIGVSAMDGYMHERIPEAIPSLIRSKGGVQLPGKLVEAIKQVTTTEKLIQIIFEERPTSHLATVVRKSMKDRT